MPTGPPRDAGARPAARFGLAGRIHTRAGDWNEDDFGSGNDALLMSSVLHGAGSRAEMKLAKAYRSMTPGAVLILQDFLLDAGQAGPLKPALFKIQVGAFAVDELVARTGLGRSSVAGELFGPAGGPHGGAGGLRGGGGLRPAPTPGNGPPEPPGSGRGGGRPGGVSHG